MAAIRRIQYIFDTTQPVRAFQDVARAEQGLVTGAAAVERHLRDLERQQNSWTRGAREVMAAERAKTAAALDTLRNVKQGSAATQEANNLREREQAIIRAGVAAESAQGKAILGVIQARQRARAEIEATIAAQRQAAQAERVLAESRSRVQDKAENFAAIRQGTQAEFQLAAAKKARQDIQRAGVAVNSAEARELTQLAQREVQLEQVTQRTTAAKQRLASIGQGLRTALTTLLPAATIAGLAAIGAQAVRTGLELGTLRTQIVNLTSITREDLRDMQDSLNELAVESGRGPVELTKALYLVGSAGKVGAEALEITRAAAKGAAIGLGDTAVIARTLTAATAAYAKEGLTARDALDILFRTVREGNAEASEIAPTLGRVVGIAAQLKVPLADVGAFIATFTRLGVDADEAVTALRGTLTTLLGPTKQQEEALALVNTTMADLRREIVEKGLAVALVDLVGKFKGNEDALSAVIPNVRALAGVLGTAGSQSKDFVNIAERVKSSLGGTADAAYKLAQQDPAHIFASLKAQVTLAGQEFAVGLIPGMVRAAEILKEVQNDGSLRTLGEAAGSAAVFVAELAKNIDLVKAAIVSLIAIKAAGVFFGIAEAAGVGSAALAGMRLGLTGITAPITALISSVAYLRSGIASYNREQDAALKLEAERSAQSAEFIRYATTLGEKMWALTAAERAYADALKSTLLVQAVEAGRKLAEARLDAGKKVFFSEEKEYRAAIERDPRVQAAKQYNDELRARLEIIKKLREDNARLPPGAEPLAASAGASSAVSGLQSISKEAQKAADRIRELVGAEQLEARQAAARDAARFHGAEALRIEIQNQEVENKLRQSGIELSELEIQALIAGARVRNEWANSLRDAIRAQQEHGDSLDRTVEAENSFVAAIVASGKAMAQWAAAGQERKTAIQAQGKALGEALADVRKQTSAALSGGTESPWAKMDSEIERIVNGSIKQLATESPAEFQARWVAAAAETRAALSDLFSAEVVAEIRRRAEETAAYIREPIVRTIEEAQARVLDATAEMLAHGKADWGALWDDFKVQAIRAVEEWLIRWIAAHRIAQAEAAKTGAVNAAAGGAGGGATGGGWMGSLAGLFGGGGSAVTATTGTTMGSQGAVLNFAGGGAGTSGAAWSTWGTYAAYGFLAWVGLKIFEGWTKARPKWGEASIAGDVAGNSRKIIEQAQKVIAEIIKTVKDFIDETNLSIERLGNVRLAQRNGLFVVRESVDAVGRAFDSAQAAMEFAAVRSLQLAEYGRETSEFIRAAIEGSRAETLQALSADIERARALEDRGKPEIFAQIRSFVTQFWEEWNWVIETFRSNAAQSSVALRQAGLGIVLGFQNLYNELTGRKPDLAAQREEIATIFNAQKRLAIAEAQLRYLEIQQQIQFLTARVGIARAHSDIDQGQLRGHVGYLKARVELVKAETTLYNQSLAALEAMLAAIGEVISGLTRIPDLVADDIKLPGVGGADRGSTREDFERRLRDLREGAMNDAARAVSQFTTALIEFRVAAQQASASVEDRAEGERLLREQLRRTIEDIIRPFTTDFGKTDFQIRYAEQQRRLAEARVAAASVPSPAAQGGGRGGGQGRSPGAPGTGGAPGAGQHPPAPPSPVTGGPKVIGAGSTGRGEETYGGWTEAELLAVPSRVATLGPHAAAKWRARHPSPAPAGSGDRLGPPASAFDTADQNLKLAFTRELDSAIASFRGLGSGLADVNRNADDLRVNVATLGLDAEETAKRLKEIGLGEASQIQQGQLGVMDRLYGYLQGSKEHAAEIEQHEKRKLDFDLKILQAQMIAWNIFDDAGKRLLDDARKLGEQAIHDRLNRARNDASSARFEAAARAQEEAARAQEEAAKRFKESTDRLIEYSRSFLTNSELTFLNPKEQVTEARRQAQTVADAAKRGSLEDRERFEEAVTNYLTLYAEVYGKGGGFFEESKRFYDILQTLIGQTTFTTDGVTFGAPFGQNNNRAVPAVTGSVSTIQGGVAATDLTELLRLLRAIGEDSATYHARETHRGAQRDLNQRKMAEALEYIRSKISLLLSKIEPEASAA